MSQSDTKSSPKRRRHLLFGANLFLGLILFFEIGFRLAFAKSFPMTYFEPHPQLGHFHVPGRRIRLRTDEYETLVVINEQGLRDDPHPYEKPEGVFRILVVGDSFVEGQHVDMEQTLASQLEVMLADAVDMPVEVINAGVSAYGTDNVLLFLENEGLRYEPDLVIYGFFHNDVIDNINHPYFRLVDGELVQLPIKYSLVRRMRRPLYDVSYIYRLGQGISILLQTRADKTLIDTPWGLVYSVFLDSPFLQDEDAWQLTAALLEEMQAVVSGADSQLVIAYLPSIEQSEDAIWQQVAAAAESLSRDAPNTRLARIIPEEARFIDLSPGFRVLAQDETLYFPIDHHYTEAGHRLAADLIYDYLTREGLLAR